MANGKKTDQQRIAAMERRIKALELRKSGTPYRQIGAQLGVSEAQAHRDIAIALGHLARLEISDAGELCTLELSRLDTLTMAATRVLLSAGDSLKLQAIDRLLRISESRRRLLGLDAAPKVPLNPDGTAPAIDTELRTVILALLPMEQRLLLADALDKVIDGTATAHGSDAVA